MKIFYYGNKNNSAISDGIVIDINPSNINNVQKEIEESNGFCLLKDNHSDVQVTQELIRIAKDGLIFGVIIDTKAGLESYAESNYIKALSGVGISVIASNPSSLFETVLCLKSGASIISFDKMDEEKIRNTKKIFEQYPDLIYGTYNQIQEGDEMISNQILGHGIMIDDENINLEDAIKCGVDSVILYK